MKEKILGIAAVAILETAFFTMCAMAGDLFADCIKMKIRENAIWKARKKANGEN